MPMEAQPPQFTGSPCGHHGTYTFYRGFRYTKNGISKDLSLGEFFFVRISAEVDPCIGELQLLCSNRNNEQQLSALRLYFLPEQTPEGRLSHHGEDEVLVASDRIVLKLEDLVTWITEEVEWNHGILAPVCKPTKGQDASPPVKEEKKEGQEETDTKGEEDENKKDISNEKEEETKPVEIKEEPSQDDTSSPSKGTNVVVLSYQKYCRFRSMMRRLEGGAIDQWLQDPVVIALGGFTATDKNTRVLFCRDNFEHDELAHHELNCEYLAPTIKGKRRKRKAKNVRSTSPESNSSVESKVIELKNNKKANGLKQPPIKNESEFLERLYNFMKQRNTPIHRVPHLGFKQIDLFIFYSFAQKLGGYDKITDKRLWKHVYDELGGNPGSTSAATCTRRHYEKLLLPFERYMDGIVYKPGTRGKKSLKRKLEKENAESANDSTPVKTEQAPGTSTEATEADTYNFTDSNHENSNSKDSNSNEFNSVCDEQAAPNEPIYSDEDSKTVWSIQKQPESKSEVDKEDTKAIKPLIIQKGQSETFAEKERKWDEIRRKNAAARKWVRQSRSSSKGCKTPVPEVPHFNGEKPASLGSEASDVHKSPQNNIKIKTENNECPPSQNVPTTPNHNQLSQDKINPSAPSTNHTVSKHPPVHSEAIQNVINKLENQKKLMARGKEAPASISCDKKSPYVKSEPIDIPSKSWSGYPANSEHSSIQSSTYSSMESNIPAHIKNQIPPSYKTASRSESDYPMHLTGRQSVGSMSASSAVSGDTSLNDENKSLLSQRRPSVIQHTEYAATTPSPTPSPKQGSSDVFNMYPKDMMPCVQFNNPKMNLPPNQMGYSMNGKVAEWLTKGVHEVVACKTPSSVEKTVELHDKVMMPSSCKTPGIVGTGKIPPSNVKNKHNVKGCAKSPRSKYSTSHQRNSDVNSLTNGNYALSRSEMRNNAMYQKTFHPTPTSYNSVMTNPVSAAKYQQTANPKPEFYPNNPYFNQQKRFKCSNTPPVLPGVGARPPSLPYVRQQTYRAAPLSDIPKTTTTHNDYESVVLDLSVKKKPVQTATPRAVNPPPPVCTSPVPEGVCLDLSIKKKPNINSDNGIENITPPLPLSPNPSQAPAPYLSSTLKPLPTLISIQDFQSAAMESARHNYSSSSSRHPPIMNSPATSSATGPSLVMPQTNAMYPASTHSKLPQSIVNSMPVAYSKEIAKNLYMPSTTRHSQFSPYVIPPFFPSSWTSVVNANVNNNPKQTNNSQTSPMAYKGMVNHSVFPKDYPSQYKSQFHPVLCKDNGHYPSNAK